MIYTTQRLILIPRGPADWADNIAMNADAQVVQFIGDMGSAQQQRDSMAARDATPWGTGLGYFTIRTHDTMAFCGWVMLRPDDSDPTQMEIGWRLSPSARGHGYAAEAAQALLNHGLGTLALPAVMAYIDFRNTASMHVARRIGMTRGVDAIYDGAPIATYWCHQAQYHQAQ